MDDRFTSRLRTAMSEPSSAPPARPEPRPAVPVRTPLYARLPAPWRRYVAVIVGLLLLALAGLWLDLFHALVIWALFSVFVLLWPNWPPRTAGEERAHAWPYEP
ncbi:MAG TPA: hypothetical protein VK066_09380 [Chloroflexota bacterium]|nr:hypothetical protein [Chloroflexota bacterium]